MRLIVYADATAAIGAGHVMRCASLAEAWIELGFGSVAHRGEITIPFARNRLAALGIESCVEMEEWEPDAVLVVDNYDERVRRAAANRRSQLKVLVDDLGDMTPGFDVIWNPNPYVAEHLYPSFTGTVISGQVPIRRDLPRWTQESSKVAVSLGGRVPPDWMLAAIDRWATTRAIRLVTGNAAWIPSGWTTVTADDPWKSFARCAMILTAGGSTVWEAAHVGIPVCVLISAPNQRLSGQWASAHGVPVIDVTAARAPARFYRMLKAHAAKAAPLPKVDSGAANVATTLHGRAGQ